MAGTRRIKAGIVGCGDIALHGYFPYVSQVFDLVATCDLIEDRAKAMASAWGAGAYYTDIDEMLATTDAEAIFVLTKMSTHSNILHKVVQAGKHFLVQKPFVTNLETGVAAVEAARKAGLKGLAEPNYWGDPVYMKAKEIIEQGHIGPVHYVVGRTERGWAPLWGGDNYYEAAGGGMLFDMGVYIISAETYLLGPAQKVTGAAMLSMPDRPPVYADDVYTDFLKSYNAGDDPFAYRRTAEATVPMKMQAYDNTFTLIEWPNACLGCVIASSVAMVLPPAGARLAVCGEKGTIAFGMQGAGARLSVATMDTSSPYHVPGSGRGPADRGNVDYYHFGADAFPRWRYTAGSVQDLHDAIVNDTEVAASMEWGLHVAEIMIKSFESAATGQALALTTTF